MKKLLFIIIGYSLLLAGCGENEAIYYEGESDSTSGIYFAYYTSTTREGASVIYNYSDTTRDNSLASVVGEYAQVRIPVRLFGNVSEEDRPFVVKRQKNRRTARRNCALHHLRTGRKPVL